MILKAKTEYTMYCFTSYKQKSQEKSMGLNWEQFFGLIYTLSTWYIEEYVCNPQNTCIIKIPISAKEGS